MKLRLAKASQLSWSYGLAWLSLAIMSFLVATNVVASRPPERRPTGTPHAYAIFCTHEILSVMEGEMGVNIPELFGQPEMSEDDPARLSVR